MSDYNKLIGATITTHHLDPRGAYLQLALLDARPIRLRTEGDCCSTTWIESIDLPSVLHGRILAVEDIPMPDRGNVGTQKHPSVECVAYYGLKITTEHGVAVIDYRNDSNGYYGGSLKLETVPQ